MTPWRPSLAGDDMHHRAEDLARLMPPLLVEAERVAATVAQGVHGRRRAGPGETFWQFRRYQPGEPASRIDWRQSARSQPLYVRETEWEAAQTVWLWRDASASMDYASAPTLAAKRDRAELLLLAVASLLSRGGERIALLGGDNAPSSGRAATSRLALALARDADEKSRSGTVPAGILLPRHARVVLFGDFLEPVDVLADAIRPLGARGVHGHLVQIFDPAEETLPFDGRIRFEGTEGEGTVLIGRAEAARADYCLRLNRHRAALGALVQSLGWTFAVHRTDAPPAPALMALYQTLAGSYAGAAR